MAYCKGRLGLKLVFMVRVRVDIKISIHPKHPEMAYCKGKLGLTLVFMVRVRVDVKR